MLWEVASTAACGAWMGNLLAFAPPTQSRLTYARQPIRKTGGRVHFCSDIITSQIISCTFTCSLSALPSSIPNATQICERSAKILPADASGQLNRTLAPRTGPNVLLSEPTPSNTRRERQ